MAGLLGSGKGRNCRVGPPANTCLLGRTRAGILLLRAEGKMERGPEEAGDPETETQEAHPEAEVSPAPATPPRGLLWHLGGGGG